MGKTLNQTSLKIIKKHPTHEFNSLIKVLKPKVYITDSSNFKNLVQELTGNGSQSSVISSSPPPTHVMPIVSLEPHHVIEIDDHDSPAPSPSPDCSSNPSLDNTLVPFDYTYCSSEELGLHWPQDHRVVNYANEIELRNLESWLLDFDPSDFNNDGSLVPINAYEYDYNMPSVM